MNIEQTKDELLIRIPKSTDVGGLERIMEYIRYREIASKSKASSDMINETATESKSDWWKANKDRFVK